MTCAISQHVVKCFAEFAFVFLTVIGDFFFFFFFSSRRRHTRSVSALLLNRSSDLLDEEKWLNMLGTFVKDWFRYESHFVHGRDSLVDILKERGLLSESDAVQPLIGKKS